jgi:hypothetical protein
VLTLLLSLAAHAAEPTATLRATFEITDDGLRYVRGSRLEGAPRPRPGALGIVDVDGEVLATAEMPPLAQTRAVITPEGHDVAHLQQRFVRVDLPWPDDAAGISFGARTIFPGGDLAPPPAEDPVAVLNSGPTANRLDLLVFAEGYQASDKAKFEQHVDFVVDHLSTIEPYSRYIGLINIWRIWTPSNDAGLDRYDTTVAGNTDLVDTYFQCYRGCDNIDRLICCDEDFILEEVANYAPFGDGVLILVNDEAYGGSGGFVYSTAFTGNAQALQVAAHELGHTLFLLWDEYTYGGLEADGEYISPNCAPPDEVVPWQHWIGDDNPEVGAFQGCSFSDWIRPTAGSCMMNVLRDDYCPICREHIVKEIYEQVKGGIVANASPEVGETIRLKAGESTTVSVETIGPGDGVVTWFLDGEVVAQDALSYELQACSEGEDGKLILTVEDPTPWVRSDPTNLLTEAVSWKIRSEQCDGQASSCGCRSTGAAGWLALLPMLWLRRRSKR